jgi:flagella basal body P-ring formation protein FlgA
MFRIVVIVVVLALVAPATAQDREKTGTPRLKSTVTVMRDTVRIGDLVDNAGDVADIPIFRAPDLGGTGTVSAADVLEAIRAHDLIVVDTAGVSDIEVTRASREIARRDIEQRIAKAFSGQYGLGDVSKLSLTFEHEPNTLFVEPQATGDLRVTRATYDPRTSRFDILLNLPGSAIARQSGLRYSGTIVETVMTPVLTRPVSRAENIKASDVVMEKRAKSEITGEIILSADEVIGQNARQPLRAGQPLRRADLVKPEMVRRDEFVTIAYEVPGIMLTIRGKAIEAGAQGDTITVLNVQTKRNVQGVVTGPGRVTMLSPTPVAIADTSEAVPSATARQSE